MAKKHKEIEFHYEGEKNLEEILLELIIIKLANKMR